MSVTDPPVTVPAPAAPSDPLAPQPAARASKAWLGWLAGFVVIAVLAGATGVLFVRVQDAQRHANNAVTIAGGNQAQLQSQLDEIRQSLTHQLSALKKCVNTALDSIAQAGQTGKAVAVTKC